MAVRSRGFHSKQGTTLWSFAFSFTSLIMLTACDPVIRGNSNSVVTTSTQALSASDASLLYVSKQGDTMVGALQLPADGLTVGTNQLVATGGKIGIGTASPQTALDVSGSGASGGKITLSNTNTNILAGDSLGALEFYTFDTSLSAGVTAKIEAIADDNGAAFGLRLGTRDNSGISRAFSIDSSGNLGAWGAVPIANAFLMHGNGDKSFLVDRHEFNNNDGYHLTIQAGGSGTVSTDKNGGNLILSSGIASGDGGSDIIFKAVADSQGTGVANRNPAEVMRIKGNGFVGIGTSGPSAPLDIGGTVQIHDNLFGERMLQSSGNFRMTVNMDSNRSLYLTQRAFSQFGVGIGDNDPDAQLEISGNGGAGDILLMISTDDNTDGDIMTVKDDGNVGIGVTNPQTKLQVAGVIAPSVTNTYSLGDGGRRFTEVFATNGVINTSDRREKKDILDTNLGLNFINKLRPVSFRWNTGIDNDIHYGLIAQEAEQAVMESLEHNQKASIVTHDEKSDRYGVRYSELISPLIKAVQELYGQMTSKADRSEIEALRADNQAKDKRIEALEQRLANIEKALSPK